MKSVMIIEFFFLYRIKFEVQALLATFRSSFDNDATPYFALIICVWGN